MSGEGTGVTETGSMEDEVVAQDARAKTSAQRKRRS
jgi:hypothetical protein